jgi:hypothetical protein
MKNLLRVAIATSLIFALTGCGSSSSDPITETPVVTLPVEPEPTIPPEEPIYPEDPIPMEPMYSVDVYDLDNGYAIEGYNENGDVTIIEYCKGQYTYYRGVESFYGDFNTDGYTINMFDMDGGSYIVDTDNGLIEVGMNYYIFDINSYIDVDAIVPLVDCY